MFSLRSSCYKKADEAKVCYKKADEAKVWSGKKNGGMAYKSPCILISTQKASNKKADLPAMFLRDPTVFRLYAK